MSHPSIRENPDLDRWIEFVDGGRIILHTGKVEIGQRLKTALALIAADELDVDFERFDVANPDTGRDPNEGFTAGSMSMQHSGAAVRMAAATARRYLLGLAGERFGVQPETLTIDDGLIVSRETNRSASYWELMSGRRFGIAVDESAPAKAPADHRWVGHSVAPTEMREIVRGTYAYLHDMVLPGMLHARLVRPPHYFAQLKNLDQDVVDSLAAQGVTVVRNGSFLAVAAPDEYDAILAAGRLSRAAGWDTGGGLPTGDVFRMLTGNEAISLPVERGGTPREQPVPPLSPPPADAVATRSARYEKPYLMHGSMGPSAGCAEYADGRLRVWTHNQGIYPLRAAIAQALGLAKEDVQIGFRPGPGCYGHNGADDAAFDAALIAKAIPGCPVLLKWTRDDEHAWEPYGTAMVCELRASINSDGKVVDWSHESYGDTFMARPAPLRTDKPAEMLLSARYVENPVGWPVVPPAMGPHLGIHRNLAPLYSFAAPRLVKHLVRGLPLRVSTLRTLGAFANVTAIESFVDELAEAAGDVPAAFRLNHLEDDRAKAVIAELDALMASQRAGAAANRGAGMGFSQYKNSAAYCATGVEVEVTDDAVVRLHRAWIVADAGEIVDPPGLQAQLEGGFLQAASWTLYEEVTFDAGGITSRDWETYPLLRFDNVPQIETVLLDRPGEPFLGAGEAAAGPTGGAIANAIYQAVGIRMRRMPFTADNLRRTAIQ